MGSVAKDPEANPELVQKMVALEQFVNNPNKRPVIALAGSTFQHRQEARTFGFKWHGWVVKYRLTDLGVAMQKDVFVGLEDGGRLTEVDRDESGGVLWAAINVFMEKGSAEPEVTTLKHGVVMTQKFIPCVLTELNPNIVTPGRVG